MAGRQTPLEQLLCLVALGMVLGLTSAGVSQTPQSVIASDLPRAEYYIARDLYDSGQVVDATEGFQAALNRARQIGQQRWIDSIPPLVMLGECYYQQGSIALALEQYDAALMLAISYQAWIDHLQVSTDAFPKMSLATKGIVWGQTSRKLPAIVLPDVLQIAVDPTAAQPLPQGGIAVPISSVTRLDATEVLRTTGVALARRAQLLGPLAQHSPLSAPLVQMFSRAPQQPAAWIQAAWKVLHALALIGSGDATQARTLLQSHSSVGSQFEYFLTPIGLLSLGRMDAEQLNTQSALVHLQDAALIAAQFDQFETMSESLVLAAGLATAERRADILPMLQGATAWSQKRSRLAFVSISASAAELALSANNSAAFDVLAKQTTAVLRLREVTLPRVSSQASYAAAQLAFSQNRASLGMENLDAALTLMRGSPRSGAVSRRVFQTEMAVDLFNRGELTVREAEPILEELLGEPSASQWALYPLDCLTSITTASLPAYEKWLDFAVRRGSPEQIVERMDRLQRQRLYEALPLGGRLFSWRQACNWNPQSLPQPVTAALNRAVQEFPTLATMPVQIQTLLGDIKKLPLPLDDRQTPGDGKKKFAELMRVSENLENLLASIALKRWPLARFAPVAGKLEEIRKLIDEDDLLIAWVETENSFHAIAVNKNAEQFWTVADRVAIVPQVVQLLSEIGLHAKPNRNPLEAKSASTKTAALISKSLFPPTVQKMIQNADRLVLVPNGNLWYLPFELLPESDQENSANLLARHPICYVPTIGMLSSATGSAPAIADTLGIFGSFFSQDRVTNQSQADLIIQAAPNSERIDLTHKLTPSSSTWIRARGDQIWVAADIQPTKNPWETRLFPLDSGPETLLSSWVQMPLKSPNRVFVLGMHSAAESTQLLGGNEIFLPACVLLSSGTRTALLSRWPVGGKSSHSALARLLEELQFEAPSTAWQRSAIALWAEQLPSANEPALPPGTKNESALVGGDHPLLWSSYILVGDHLSPQRP